MGKITVKHYLNTKVKPEIKEDKEYYPIYIQITINRKTTQYRSKTQLVMDETNFYKYINGREYEADFYNMGIFTKDYFEKEPTRIEKSFEFILKQWESETLNKKNFDIIWSYINGLFLMWTNSALIELTWNYITQDTEKAKLYLLFNKEIAINESLECLKKYFSVEIKEKLPQEDLEFWNNTYSLLRQLKKDSIYIDFVYNYDYEISKCKKIKDKISYSRIIKKITSEWYDLCQ